MDISEKIEKLRKEMAKRNINAYVIPSADYHQSEYVGDYFKAREYMTGFTGSAGTAVFTASEAALWTDGRYFLQAAEQLEQTEICLQKMGEPGTPTIDAYLREKLPEGGCVGFDGRTVGISVGNLYEKIAGEKGGSVYYKEDLVDFVWTDRPELPRKKAFALEEQYTGESSVSKLERVREKMESYGADVHLLTSLDDIGWLLNIRGQDVEYFPLLLSYALVWMDQVDLYVEEDKISENIRKEFDKNQIIMHPYNEIYRDIETVTEGCKILLDPRRVNYALYKNLPASAELINKENPSTLMKAVKNETEAEHIRQAHLKDGIAHTRFFYWLKHTVGKERITERDAARKLEEFRAQQEHYLGASFEPISAYKEHGAIVHYTATEETDADLEPKGFLLTDTGGHYWEGSTDITRTVALGPLTEEEKEDFTLVAAGMLKLADSVFPAGCTGAVLDYAAREPLWKRYKDFNHGTGHGVGYLGNIHEPPATINWRIRPGNTRVLQKNMVITDEPGIYIEGSHGIRTENELMVKEEPAEGFLGFEILTFVPVDLDAILPDLLGEEGCRLLNAYHSKVREMVGPYLPEEEKEWLDYYTRPVRPARAI